MTGFRLALGGAQELFRQKPDLTVLGKIVGGGLPVGDVRRSATRHHEQGDARRSDIPGWYAFRQPAGDGSGLGDAARVTRPSAVSEVGRTRQEAGCGASSSGFQAYRIKSRASGVCGRAILAQDSVTDYDSAKKSDTARFARFFWAMMERGVYLPCSQFEAAFISAAHTEEHVEETIMRRCGSGRAGEHLIYRFALARHRASAKR